PEAGFFSPDESMDLWDLASGELRSTLQIAPPHDEPIRWDEAIYDIAFSPDNSVVVSTHGETHGHGERWESPSNPIRIWDTETSELLTTLEGHTDRTTSTIFSEDGKLLITGSWDGTVRIWGVPGSE
ncbi:MAG TPA: hypothetical protein VJZ27_09500, partial [Aggregatilineales bacterium]|nr:hypothetical protein [Aggregatilineales bacterium]